LAPPSKANDEIEVEKEVYAYRVAKENTEKVLKLLKRE
jgi:hypothetical protein